MLAASAQWPDSGIPESPRGWLIQVASRRMLDQLRSEGARRRREELSAALDAPPVDAAASDDALLLLFLCCHPALSTASAIALTLRAVGGLTTHEIAAAFLVPESTMAQRISRAKRSVEETGARFELPPGDAWRERLDAVLQVLYLIFNEGYATSGGAELQRSDLSGEALRLARLLRRLVPDDGEVAGLLALMLLTDARRNARTGAGGELVPLAEQDRALWDREAIAEGVALITRSMATEEIGPYQLQAAIAAIHDEAKRAEDTDWPQILALYGLLDSITGNPMVKLNHAVAVGMVRGPRAGLELLDTLDADDDSPATTASTRCARTCSRWRASGRRRSSATCARPSSPRAFPSSATSPCVRRGSARSRPARSATARARPRGGARPRPQSRRRARRSAPRRARRGSRRSAGPRPSCPSRR